MHYLPLAGSYSPTILLGKNARQPTSIIHPNGQWVLPITIKTIGNGAETQDISPLRVN